MADVPEAASAEQHATQDAPLNTANDANSSSSPTTSAAGTNAQPASSSLHHDNPASSQLSPVSPISQTEAPLSVDTQPPQIPALGPATDSPIVASGTAPATGSGSDGTFLSISLLLTTGARHPYRIDEKYLRSRKVSNAAATDGRFDPRELSAYQLKELIWIDWRAEWEPRPVSPSSIRLIIMGRMLEDKAALKDYPFSLERPNVVHMTVKPADLVDDDETGGKAAGKGGLMRGRDTEEQGAGCRCVIL